MLVIQNEFFEPSGKLNSNVSDALDSAVQQLVTNVLAEIPLPHMQSFIVQMYLRQIVISRVDLAFAMEFVKKAATAGQGWNAGAPYDPLKILEDDLGTAYEKVEQGRWEDNSPHDMLYVFKRFLSSAKKGTTYFDDEE